jgi:glycosyltransferase involved in cell wall biosynthesis
MARMTAPFFSVLIPTYNREATIAETLESVAAQEFRDFECIVVDDGSTDATCSIVTGYNFVKLIRQQNAGPGTARNRGVQQAGGQYIAFLDSDDLWFPWSLRSYRDAIESCECPAFLAGTPLVFHGSQDLSNVRSGPLVYRPFADYLSSGEEWLWYGVSSFVIRRDAFLDAGGFAEGRINGEDAELAMRLGTAAGFVHLESPPSFAYRVHAGNVTLDRRKAEQGLALLVDGERTNRFPGGPRRSRERSAIISRHIRPFAIESARCGDFWTALRYYRAVFGEALASRRFRFLMGLPILAAQGLIRKTASRLSRGQSPR